MIIVSIMYLL